MSSLEITILINIVVILFSLGVSLFPIWWSRTHNSDYASGYRLILPSLAQMSVGCFLFLIPYVIRLLGILNDEELQRIFRFVIPVFFLSPFTMVVSLHYWKR